MGTRRSAGFTRCTSAAAGGGAACCWCPPALAPPQEQPAQPAVDGARRRLLAAGGCGVGAGALPPRRRPRGRAGTRASLGDRGGAWAWGWRLQLRVGATSRKRPPQQAGPPRPVAAPSTQRASAPAPRTRARLLGPAARQVRHVTSGEGRQQGGDMVRRSSCATCARA